MFDKTSVGSWTDNNIKWFYTSNLLVATKIIELFTPIYPFVDFRVNNNGSVEVRVNIKGGRNNCIPINSIDITDRDWELYPLLIIQVQINGNYILINRVSANGITEKRKLYHLDFNKEKEYIKEYLKDDWGIVINEIN